MTYFDLGRAVGRVGMLAAVYILVGMGTADDALALAAVIATLYAGQPLIRWYE